MLNSNRFPGIIGGVAVSFAAVLWGLDGIVLTPRLHNLDVGFVVFIVHLIPFAIMQFFFARQYSYLKRFSSSDFLYLFLVSLTGGALGTISIVTALFLVEFKSLSVVVLLQKLQPVFAIILAALILKERVGKNFIFWAGLAILASYFLTFGFSIPNLNTGSTTIYAALYALLAAFCFGAATVIGKKILVKYDFHTTTFYRYGITSLIMLIYMLLAGQFSGFRNATSQNWLIFIIISLTTGSGAIFLYYFGLKKTRAVVASICELFFPVSAILFDYWINDSVLSAVQWISAAVMLLAIINLNRREIRKK